MEKYSAKGYVAPANSNKGAKKQEAWVEMVRTIQQQQKNISQSVSKILTTISQHDNIPRKKASFLRFLQNSFRYMKMDDIEAAWNLLEEEMKKSKPQPATNGTKTEDNGTNGATKRKLEDETPVNGSKKAKTEEIEVAEEAVETNGTKFDWTTTIKDILLSKNNQLKLSKLKKKVFRKYRTCTGTEEISDKIEKKFNKKLRKLGLLIKEDTVQLIE